MVLLGVTGELLRFENRRQAVWAPAQDPEVQLFASVGAVLGDYFAHVDLLDWFLVVFTPNTSTYSFLFIFSLAVRHLFLGHLATSINTAFCHLS